MRLTHSARFLGASERQVMHTVIVPSALAWTEPVERRLFRWRPEHGKRA